VIAGTCTRRDGSPEWSASKTAARRVQRPLPGAVSQTPSSAASGASPAALTVNVTVARSAAPEPRAPSATRRASFRGAMSFLL
jgi:hypothetical protein